VYKLLNSREVGKMASSNLSDDSIFRELDNSFLNFDEVQKL
jgi:hypothetical protein